MYISKIDIYSYGKFINQSYNLSDGLTVFEGVNGSGKSTLMSFIISVMFGFPDMRRRDQRAYDTNPHAVYGGKLWLNETDYGDVQIERTKVNGKQSLHFFDEEGERHDVEDFDFLFKRITRDDFTNLFSFSEDELLQFVWSDNQALQQNIAELTTNGHQQIMHNIVPKLQREADDIYLPNGQKPTLNQQLSALEAENETLEDDEREESHYFELKAELQSLNDKLIQLEQTRKDLNQKTVDLQVADQQSDLVRQFREADQAIANYNFIGFSDEDYNRYAQLTERQQQLKARREQLDSSSDRAASATTNDTLSDGVQWIIDHQNISADMVAEARAYRQFANEDSEIHDQIVQKRYRERSLLAALGIQSIDELPEPLSEDENNAWLERKKDIDNRRVFYQNTKSGLENLQQQRTDLSEERKEVMQDYDDFKEYVPNLITSWIKTFGWILLGIGGVLIVLFLFTQRNFLIGSGIASLVLGALFAVFGWYQSSKGKRFAENEDKNYRLDIRDIDSERAELQRRIDDQNDQLKELEEQSSAFNQDVKDLVKSKGGSESIAPLVWLQTDYADQIRQIESDIADLVQSSGVGRFSKGHEDLWDDYQDALDSDRFSMDVVYRTFEDQYAEAKQYIGDHQFELKSQEQYQQDSRQLDREEDRVVDQLADLMLQYDYDDFSFFEADIEKEHRMADQKRERDRLKQQLNEAVMTYNLSDQTIDEQITANQDRLGDINTQVNQTVNDIARLNQQIDDLEHRGLVDDQKQKMRDALDGVYESSVDWASRQLAIDALTSQVSDFGSDQSQAVLSQAGRYLNRLSDGRLEKLVFNDKQLALVIDGETRDAIQLSRGERLLLFLALRFAFIDTVLPDQELPIIIDEAFAHLDDDTREAVYNLLEERAMQGQVLLFTHDQRIEDWVDREHLTILNRE
ncbi:MAG: AAA family ATPase [Aerococcus sp.]|nr:AAA family ATPase [Aerococcus sp.]